MISNFRARYRSNLILLLKQVTLSLAILLFVGLEVFDMLAWSETSIRFVDWMLGFQMSFFGISVSRNPGLMIPVGIIILVYQLLRTFE